MSPFWPGPGTDRERLIALLREHQPRERSVIECSCGFAEPDHFGISREEIEAADADYATHLADVIERATS